MVSLSSACDFGAHPAVGYHIRTYTVGVTTSIRIMEALVVVLERVMEIARVIVKNRVTGCRGGSPNPCYN